MIVLDTNVISEMMREDPDANVVRWSTEAGRLHTTAITVAEVEYGIARLPDGRRKDELRAIAATVFADFGEVILPFDVRAARWYGEIVAGRERTGRPIAAADGQIAAICASREATLATRNIDDFGAAGFELINPWKPQSQ
ncbi:MAG: type II toxin-antitoxin system VapC family toxin [Nocardioidaceae bacterium]